MAAAAAVVLELDVVVVDEEGGEARAPLTPPAEVFVGESGRKEGGA